MKYVIFLSLANLNMFKSLMRVIFPKIRLKCAVDCLNSVQMENQAIEVRVCVCVCHQKNFAQTEKTIKTRKNSNQLINCGAIMEACRLEIARCSATVNWLRLIFHFHCRLQLTQIFQRILSIIIILFVACSNTHTHTQHSAAHTHGRLASVHSQMCHIQYDELRMCIYVAVTDLIKFYVGFCYAIHLNCSRIDN